MISNYEQIAGIRWQEISKQTATESIRPDLVFRDFDLDNDLFSGNTYSFLSKKITTIW